MELAPDAEGRFGLELTDDCTVSAVTPGGPAAHAGICAGMEICHLDLKGVALKSEVLRSLAARDDAMSAVTFGIYVPDELVAAAEAPGAAGRDMGSLQCAPAQPAMRR